jgi:hypothetical protein
MSAAHFQKTADLFLHPEDGGRKILRNVAFFLPEDINIHSSPLQNGKSGISISLFVIIAYHKYGFTYVDISLRI